MLTNFCIIHRRKPRVFSPNAYPVWATCLRSLAFANTQGEILDLDAQDEVYVGARAYAFLLEIVCGLHSPIVGETEVFGQFKNFMTEWLKVRPEHRSLAQKVLTDAKAIRAKHLSHLGNQSYGSWLRKNVRADEVHILGGGQLAREVLPYLAKQGKRVIVHVRDPRNVDFHQPNLVYALQTQAFRSGALIVAAPMTASEIENWLGPNPPSQVFDLRDNSGHDPIKHDHHGLKAIFDQIERNKSRLVPVIESARADILEASSKIGTQALIRPQGWDDLCA